MRSKKIRILIVGAGASGCFCAAQLRRSLPGADIRIVEAGSHPLSKLALTGGGRCNITNGFSCVESLGDVYPRGERLMKRALNAFSPKDTLEWFGAYGIRFVAEDGGRIFPASGDAMQVVNALLAALDGVKIECNCRLKELPQDADCMVVATGGGRGMEILAGLPVEIETPVPSLFTFNISDSASGGRSAITALMGLSVPAWLSIPGTKFRSEGPLLITDWGFSGPAALKLSSFAARYLAEHGYNSELHVRWMNGSEEMIREVLSGLKSANPRKLLSSVHPDIIPSRLWTHLLGRAGLRDSMTWGETGSGIINKLARILLCDIYYIHGKASFREEFVTCGGVSLKSIDLNTLECRQRPGLYFAGEVLDVDAVTGGFNLQAAWSTAYMAAKSIINKYDT